MEMAKWILNEVKKAGKVIGNQNIQWFSGADIPLIDVKPLFFLTIEVIRTKKMVSPKLKGEFLTGEKWERFPVF